MSLKRREFLATGIAMTVGSAAAALAQQGAAPAPAPAGGGRGAAPIPKRTAKTTPLFKPGDLNSGVVFAVRFGIGAAPRPPPAGAGAGAAPCCASAAAADPTVMAIPVARNSRRFRLMAALP